VVICGHMWTLGASPTIVNSNASAAKIYNATTHRILITNIFFTFVKRSNLLQRWRCSCKFRSRRIGSRVKRLCKFSPNERLFSYVVFNYRCSPNFWANSIRGKSHVGNNFDQKCIGLGTFWAIFFTISSHHPGGHASSSQQSQLAFFLNA
jgi:hypothetical protein